MLLAAGATYKRYPWIMAFLDGIFIVGFIILLQDTIWLSINTLRWIGQYGASMGFFDYWIRFPQNIAGLVFCFLIASDKWGEYVRFNQATVSTFIIYLAYLVGVFILAPDPSLTDWTYGIRFGYSDFRILEAFILSHVIGKGIIAWIFFTIWAPCRWALKTLRGRKAYQKIRELT